MTTTKELYLLASIYNIIRVSTHRTYLHFLRHVVNAFVNWINIKSNKKWEKEKRKSIIKGMDERVVMMDATLYAYDSRKIIKKKLGIEWTLLLLVTLISYTSNGNNENRNDKIQQNPSICLIPLSMFIICKRAHTHISHIKECAACMSCKKVWQRKNKISLYTPSNY